MSSPPRSQEREEERRLNIRTLAIASVASATAAIVTSQFWAGGTPIAAAVTPVVVALVSEMLHRPTEAIARRITSEGPAIRDAPLTDEEPLREERRPESTTTEPPVRIYGSGRAPRKRRKIAVGAVVTTAVLAFAIAAVALTVPELITGRSIVKGDRHTTLVPTKKKSSSDDDQQDQQTTPTTPEEQSPSSTSEDQPQQRTTTTPTETETTPTETATTPKNQPK